MGGFELAIITFEISILYSKKQEYNSENKLLGVGEGKVGA